MHNYPTVMALPFSDGVREVPEHVGMLLKQHQIPTHEMTYAQAMERLNWMNANNAVDSTFNKIRDSHLRNFGI